MPKKSRKGTLAPEPDETETAVEPEPPHPFRADVAGVVITVTSGRQVYVQADVAIDQTDLAALRFVLAAAAAMFPPPVPQEIVVRPPLTEGPPDEY